MKRSKIQVNTEIIQRLKLGESRFDNWLNHYKSFNGDLVDFLQLNKISDGDKRWVALRLLPRFEVEVFTQECAAAAYAAYAADGAADAADAAAYAAAYAADAAAAAAYAADSAAYAAAYAADSAAYAAADAAYAAADAAERNRQINSLIYLAKRIGVK